MFRMFLNRMPCIIVHRALEIPEPKENTTLDNNRFSFRREPSFAWATGSCRTKWVLSRPSTVHYKADGMGWGKRVSWGKMGVREFIILVKYQLESTALGAWWVGRE